jgi:hypothetical protein
MLACVAYGVDRLYWLMKTLLYLTLSALTAYFLVLLLPLILLAWFRHNAMERRTLFDAANCAEYMATEYSTQYTAAEIDAAYRLARLKLRMDEWVDGVEERITK